MRGRETALRHWLPRLFVLGSVLAMALPTPSFVAGLSRDERVLWWSEILWVLGVPAAFVAVLAAVLRLHGLRRRAAARPDEPEG